MVELISKMKALQDPVVQDAIVKKEAELKVLQDKVAKLTTRDAKPGTKGPAAVQRLQGIQSAQAGRFTAQAQRAAEGAAKSEKRRDADLEAIDEAIAELHARKKAVVDAHAAADAAHQKVREQNEALAAEVDRLLEAKVQAAIALDPNALQKEQAAEEGEEGMEQDQEENCIDLWELIQRKAPNLTIADMPTLTEVPKGSDLEMLNEMYARYASLDMGNELPWMITYAQLGANISMAKSLLGTKCWEQIYEDDEEVTAASYVPRQLVVLIGQRLLVAKATHDVIVASAEAQARAKEALALADEETASNNGWKVVKAPKRRRCTAVQPPAAES
jgi:hypothetical protein